MKKKNFFKYLNVTEFDHNWGMYVTSAGYSKVNPDDDYPREKHPSTHQLTWDRGRILDDYYIIFIAKGQGVYSSALTKPENIVAGTCFFLFPGIRHRYKPDPQLGWEEYWVGFNGVQVQHMMNKGIFKNTEPIVDMGYDSNFLFLFNKLIENIRSSFVGYPQQIAGITQQLLGLISMKSNHSILGSSLDEKLIAKGKYLLQQSFEQPINMEELSNELPMGYSSFRKKFKEFTGLSPNQYLLTFRLKRAEYLLLMTKLNISEIGTQVGFDNVFYFSKMFKQKYGISPKTYRNNTQNNHN